MRAQNFRPATGKPIALAAILAVGAATAHAGLILSPAGGFTEISAGDDDVVTQQLSSTFKFYGQNFNSVDISTNGNLNFTGNTDFANVGFPDASAGGMIAPLWSDFVLFQNANSHVIYNQGSGYFGVTWSNVSTFFNQSQKFTFQAVVFNQNENLNGFNFHAGDIAFGYSQLGGPLNSADTGTVGLNNADGSKSAGLPGNGQTLISSADFSKLQPFKSEFILYRYDGSNYVASYEHPSAVPEPTSLAALAVGALALWPKRRKRR